MRRCSEFAIRSHEHSETSRYRDEWSSKDDDAHMTAGSAAADPKRKGRAESDDGEGLGTTHVEDAGVMTDVDAATTADGDQAGGAKKGKH